MTLHTVQQRESSSYDLDSKENVVEDITHLKKRESEMQDTNASITIGVLADNHINQSDDWLG